MSINVVELAEGQLPEYDDLVDSSPEGTIFHKSWWLKLFNHRRGPANVRFYGAFENGSLVSGFPVFTASKLLFRFTYHPILTPYLGPFYVEKCLRRYRENTWKKEINEEFAKRLLKNGICLYYSFNHHMVDLLPYIWQGFEPGIHFTYVLNLKDLSEVWKNIDKKRRGDITRSLKDNYTIDYGDIDNFCLLNNETMKRQRHKQINNDALKAIYGECKKHDSCEVFTAYRDSSPVASMMIVWDPKRSYYIGSGFRGNSQGVMSLLIWEAIKYTKLRLGLSEFDFEGTKFKSIEFYFRKFGGELRPIYIISDRSLKKHLILKIYHMLK